MCSYVQCTPLIYELSLKVPVSKVLNDSKDEELDLKDEELDLKDEELD